MADATGARSGSDLFVVDNSDSDWDVLRYLAGWCRLSKGLDVATAYFEIGSLLALDGQWQQLDNIRILMGDEVAKKTKAALVQALTMRLDLSIEAQKVRDDFLDGVPAIVDAIKAGHIKFRVYRKTKFHARAFITHGREEVIGAFALVGSSNFTRPGLTSNVELNVQISGANVTLLQEWYEHYWDEAEDITADMLRTIERHVEACLPFDVWTRSLAELFRHSSPPSDIWAEQHSRVYPELDRYQREGYAMMIERARKYGGAFLCDGVGLGKTFVGLMLLERLIVHEKKTVLLLEKLTDTFTNFNIIDLHGDFKRGVAPDGQADGNVFEDVAQGVAIAIGTRLPTQDGCTVLKGDMFGSEEKKLSWLSKNDISAGNLVDCVILPPENLFKSLDPERRTEFRVYPLVSDIMNRYGDPAPGIVTTHDDFAISFTEDEQKEKVARLLNTANEDQARLAFKLCKQEQWNYSRARASLSTGTWEANLGPIANRPFDRRITVFDSNVAVHLRARATSHMRSGENVALVTTRQRSQSAGLWPNVFAVDLPIDNTTISNKTKEINYIFPLWLMPHGTETSTFSNIAPTFARRLASLTGLAWDDCVEGPRQGALSGVVAPKPEQTALFTSRRERGEKGKSFGPRDLFDWIYAVLHSPAYRLRYADFLKGNFARVPLPAHCELFETLVPLGTELVALHLLDTNALKILADPGGVRLAGHGEARVTQAPAFDATLGRIFISPERWFETVPEPAWSFHIGSYQPAQKWLRDRAAKGGKRANPGRVLTPDDILHYRRIIVALTRTAELMPEIDRIIKAHGGWPGAFRGVAEDVSAEAAQ